MKHHPYKFIFIILLICYLNSACSFYKIRKMQLDSKFNRAGMDEKIVELENGTIQFWKGGQGDPLLIIHGFGADAQFQWFDQVGPLGKKYTLIVPNLLYFGNSSSTKGVYSVDFQVETILQLMDHLNIDTFHCIGMSYGGLVAFSIASDYPNRIKKLILVDSPGTAITESEINRFLKSFNKNSVEEVFLPDNPEDIKTLLKIAYYHPPYVPKFILRDIHKHLFLDKVEEKLLLIQTLLNNKEKLLSRPYCIPQETLIIWGQYDPVFPIEVAQRLKQRIGNNAQIKIIENTAHAPNLERPKVVNRTLLEFLALGENLP